MILTPALRTPANLHLASTDPDWAILVDYIGPCELQLRAEREPYEALVRAIAHQQLHGKAAEAILKRFRALYPGDAFPSPELVLATDEAKLRGCGWSMSKIAALREIANKTLSGIVPTLFDAQALDDEALIERLTSLRGVGRWTVEMLLIFTLGRPDVLPVDDFGVREGWRAIKGLDKQLRPKGMAALGEAWSPYRSTAAWYLWRAAEAARAHARMQAKT